MKLISTTIGAYDFLEWVAGFEAMEEVEGLDPTGMTSKVGPSDNTSFSYFSSLIIKVTFLFPSCWCMPFDLLGLSTQTLGCITPVTLVHLSGDVLFLRYDVRAPTCSHASCTNMSTSLVLFLPSLEDFG